MPDEKTPLRAALEAAYDEQVTEKVETPPEEQVETAPEKEVAPEVVEAQETEEQKAQRLRDEKGRFAKEEAKPEEKKVEEKAPEQKKPGQPLTAADTKPTPPEVGQKPPASWRPAEREAWAQVPKAAREAVERREREIDTALRESAADRQNWNRFKEMARPYEQIMLMNGTNDPVVSASNMFRTAAILQMGNDHQKAQAAAQVIAQFAINPELVGAYLSGQVQGQMPAQQQPMMRDPRVDALEARMEAARQEAIRANASQMEASISQFAQNAEWFDDVRTQMADIIEVWNRQGKVNPANLTEVIKKAYDTAVSLDEGVQAAIKQRQAAQKATATQQVTQKARAASSSLKSQPAVGGNATPKGRREALEQAFDEQVSRGAR